MSSVLGETSVETKKEQVLADCQAEIRKHEFQADYDRRSIQKLYEAIESQKRRNLSCSSKRRTTSTRSTQLLHEQLLKQNWYLREAHEQSLSEMEELKRFQGSTVDTIAKRKLVEDRDTILELTDKIQELRNENNCMIDSIDFQAAESVRSGHSHVASQPVSFPPHPVPGGMPSRSIGMPSRKNGPSSIWDTHTVYRETFLQIQQRLLQHLIRRSRIHGPLIYQNKFNHHMLRRVRTKHQFRIRDASPDRQPEIQSSPVEGDSSKNYGADQQQLQISDLHFDKFSTPVTFACWKIRFKIKEVELVDSVDDLKSSHSVKGMRRLLQHWTESSIIPNSK